MPTQRNAEPDPPPPSLAALPPSVQDAIWRAWGQAVVDTLNRLAAEPAERAAVWVWDDELTVEYAGDTLARYRVAYEADGHHLREVGEPRLFATGHTSPQPFLPPLEGVDWRPARRLAPYRPRRKRVAEGKQERLLAPEIDAATG